MTGLFYRLKYSITELCDKIWGLGLPRYNLNDIFPLDENGYTKITHSVLLEHGIYYAGGPLLFENINDITFKSKIKYGRSLILYVDMYRSKGHVTCSVITNCKNLVIKYVKVIGYWK